MKFTLSIDCDNAAFAPMYDDASEEAHYNAARGEVARMLDGLPATLREEITRGGARSGFLRDTNGNRVGQWSLSDMDDAPGEAWTTREEAYEREPAWSLFDNGLRAAVGLTEEDARRICDALNKAR